MICQNILLSYLYQYSTVFPIRAPILHPVLRYQYQSHQRESPNVCTATRQDQGCSGKRGCQAPSAFLEKGSGLRVRVWGLRAGLREWLRSFRVQGLGFMVGLFAGRKWDISTPVVQRCRASRASARFLGRVLLFRVAAFLISSLGFGPSKQKQAGVLAIATVS